MIDLVEICHKIAIFDNAFRQPFPKKAGERAAWRRGEGEGEG